MRVFLSEHLLMRHLLVGHCFGLNQLILLCTDKRPDPFVHVFPSLFSSIVELLCTCVFHWLS